MTTTEPITRPSWLDFEALCPRDVRDRITRLTEIIAAEGLGSTMDGQPVASLARYYLRALEQSTVEASEHAQAVLGPDIGGDIGDPLYLVVATATGYQALWNTVDDVTGGADTWLAEPPANEGEEPIK